MDNIDNSLFFQNNDISISPTPVQNDLPDSIPVIDNLIPAGFPSPLQGLHNDSIDLNRELIAHPASTFCARVSGNSMIDSGISDGDIIIIDKSLEPADGSIGVCYLNGEFTLKHIAIRNDGIYLVPANSKFPEIKVDEEANFQVWGVVTFIIKPTRNNLIRT